MEILLLLVLITLLVVIYNKISSKLVDLKQTINSLRIDLETLRRSSSMDLKPQKEEETTSQHLESVIIKEEEVFEEKDEFTLREELVEEDLTIHEQSVTQPQIFEEPIAAFSESIAPEPIVHKPSFWERNPDLEKFIGENLINKIGIAILVLGIGFFVKYAIDKEWINEYGRVSIGILAGGALIGVAHRLRKAFIAFSSVLIGGGIAILYFTISIGFHDYQIFGQTTAFIIMVLITGFTIFLSSYYNRVELAVLAIIGGFTAPFLVSTGEGNYVVLFSYLLILNVGMLILAYLKNWSIINIVSYAFTVLLYAGWLGTKVVGVDNPPYLGALIFATLFYLIFFLMNIINNVKEARKFQALEISLILSNTFFYFAAGMVILENIQGGLYQGLFTVLMAIFNFVFVLFLSKKERADKNLLYLLIGLVLTFVSLAAPIQLEGNYITLFWAIEACLLLWLSQKSEIGLLKLSSVIVTFLMLISLLMDWNNIYQGSENLLIILNKGFVTSLVCLGSLFFIIKKMDQDIELKDFIQIKKSDYLMVLSFIAVIIGYVAMLLELNHQVNVYVANVHFRNIIIGLYNYIFLISLLYFILKVRDIFLRKLTILLGLIGILAYLFHYQLEIAEFRGAYLLQEVTAVAFTFHYLLVAGVLVCVFMLYRLFKSTLHHEEALKKVAIWFVSFIIVFISSAELINILVWTGERSVLQFGEKLIQIRKIGFPILWGLCSFAFMYLGMVRKTKDLRIVSLTLFFITLLKLFLFDLSGISEGGKIASFIILGIILLIVSFMYQKLKALILDDKPNENVSL